VTGLHDQSRKIPASCSLRTDGRLTRLGGSGLCKLYSSSRRMSAAYEPRTAGLRRSSTAPAADTSPRAPRSHDKDCSLAKVWYPPLSPF
jgi:hypothetical protein